MTAWLGCALRLEKPIEPRAIQVSPRTEKIRANCYTRPMYDDQDFDADEFQKLPVKERAKRCLERARQTERLGKAAQGDHRAAYARLARQWRLLAEEIRRAPFH